MMSQSLNDIQLEILKLFNHYRSAKDLKEIKSLLTAYVADKVVREADAAFGAHHYPENIFDKWKSEHFRKPHSL